MCFLVFFMYANTCAASSSSAPRISAQSAVILQGGETLYQKDANRRLPMASTTKIMTAIVAIENTHTSDIVTIKEEHCLVEGSSMYLKPDTERTVLELLMGLLLVSGNDAALALADHVSGSVEKFTELMNMKSRELGMSDTNFTNPHGLNHASHYSTAYDLAVLMEYCMKNDLFRQIVSMKSFESDGAQLLNHNKLLFSCPGCIGGKTGYTSASGRCLVSCCEREDTPLICVTLSAPDDWNDHIKLYNWIYSDYSKRSVTENVRFDVPIVSELYAKAYLVPEDNIFLFVKDSSKVSLNAKLPWYVFPPVVKGDKGGSVSILVDGKSVGEYYLIYSDNHF